MIATTDFLEPQVDLTALVQPTRNYFHERLERSRSRVVRRIHDFAEQDIILPTGPRKDRPFRLDTQPFARLLWDEFYNDHWYEYAITGCTQTGKSLLAFALPILWCCCELGEDVIVAAPTKEITHDKVLRDFKPVIQRSKFAHLWPTTGGAARSGVPDLITLNNGAAIKIMSFEGGDKSKASFTCKNQFFTEIDGEKPSNSSAEANAIEQILARGRSEEVWNRFVCMECTASYEKAPIWHFVHHVGSATKIVLECPKCEAWVCPEREHLKGWETARDIIEAEENTHWHCPACDQPWDADVEKGGREKERYQANLNAKLLHKGQKISKRGKITGPMPPTRTLGFRFSAVNSMFLSPRSLGVDCFKAAHAEDEIDAEKKLTQFVFAQPYRPEAFDTIELDTNEMEKRKAITTKGVVPKGTMAITIGVDVGKYRCHWVAIAWVVTKEHRRAVIFDYGKVELAYWADGYKYTAKELDFEMLFTKCMDDWKASIDKGWPSEGGEIKAHNAMWIDCRWQGEEKEIEPVYDAIKRWQDKRCLPLMGHSGSSQGAQRYKQPKINPRTGNVADDIVRIGKQYHVVVLPDKGVLRVHLNSDHWKEKVHERVTTEVTQPGALIFFESKNPKEHHEINRHIAAEQKSKDFVPGAGRTKGDIAMWDKIRAQNHFLDAIAYACGAGHMAGFRIVDPAKLQPKQQPPPLQASVITSPDGRAFVASQR